MSNMSKQKNRGGIPSNQSISHDGTTTDIIPTKGGKTCPKRKKGCGFLGKKNSCSINGSLCDC